ncbi:MAG TPA: hypothetical protein VHE34_25900 [Puia sp.]|uniref:hypothetical protein n=1 Tax=Puia sp. TaxID=2045100 RepID=UPI002BAE9763|nr:hypothetical protein [Puia sp.]HVU98693.1 hypothetical protein [Puia sp.]
MNKWLVIPLLLAGIRLGAQPLYQLPAGTHSRVSSFENLNGGKGQGGKSNATAKGHAFEDLKAGETKTLLDVATGIVQRSDMALLKPIYLATLTIETGIELVGN